MGCSISCPLQGGCSNPLGEEASLSFFFDADFFAGGGRGVVLRDERVGEEEGVGSG